MKLIENANLQTYTTIKIGVCASVLAVPESENELIQYVIDKKPSYYIGGGQIY